MKLETLPTEQVYGVAKRISLDLEKYPLHSHAAIINMVNTMCQHRKIVLESEIEQKQIAANEAAMADARKAHAEQQVRRETQIADQMRAAQEPTKAPRLSIVLNKPRDPSEADLDAVVAEQEAAAATLAEVAVQ